MPVILLMKKLNFMKFKVILLPFGVRISHGLFCEKIL